MFTWEKDGEKNPVSVEFSIPSCNFQLYFFSYSELHWQLELCVAVAYVLSDQKIGLFSLHFYLLKTSCNNSSCKLSLMGKPICNLARLKSSSACVLTCPASPWPAFENSWLHPHKISARQRDVTSPTHWGTQIKTKSFKLEFFHLSRFKVCICCPKRRDLISLHHPHQNI